MVRKTLRTNGVETEVEILGPGLVAVPGHAGNLTIIDQGDGRALIETDEGSVRAFVAGSGDTRWVFIDGQVWQIEIVRPDGRRKAGAVGREEALTAPMPATVLTINTSVGETVGQGDVLIVLEAMKMELPIRAPRAGTVRAINCQPGELVQPGVVLLVVE